MPNYDAAAYDPPAPVTSVSLQTPGGTNVSNILLLIDSGADITLLPRAAVQLAGIDTIPGLEYEIVGFDGRAVVTQAVDLDLIFLNRVFRGRYLLTDEPHGVLGRDVLAGVIILLDGPSAEWSEYQPR